MQEIKLNITETEKFISIVELLKLMVEDEEIPLEVRKTYTNKLKNILRISKDEILNNNRFKIATKEEKISFPTYPRPPRPGSGIR